jgi:hypothetical protein
MTKKPTQSEKPIPLEPTWTDVARAVFRTGERNMSLEKFTLTLLRLFGELVGRCDAEVIGKGLQSAFEELEKNGFFDKSMRHELDGRGPSR